MSGFKCESCDFDLSLRMDLMASAIKEDHPAGYYPEDLQIDGFCGCGESFHFSGEMFTYFMLAKVEEGIIGPELEEYEIVQLELTDEQEERVAELIESGDSEELKEYMRQLMQDIDD